jgi:hypothetical protein
MPSRRQRRRQALEERLRPRDLDGLRQLAAEDPNVLSGLVGLLNERDDLLRWRAIEALGLLCAERVGQGEDGMATVRDLVRRQLWSMNDESGNVAWHAAEALGEILHRVPPLADEFAHILLQHLEMPIFRAGVLWAVGRLASARPELFRERASELSPYLEDPDPLVRAHAAWALAQLGVDGAPPSGVLFYDFESGELR